MRLSDELRVRTKRYASCVVRLYAGLPRQREEVRVIGHQLLRSGTSVAGHAREASRARSDAEFCSKLDGLLQEADESLLWLELLKEDCAIEGEPIAHLLTETNELLAIFTTIVSKTRQRNPKEQ
jgi:four helix bundle protein